MSARYCCICSQEGHHSHECPGGDAFRLQWHSKPEPTPVVLPVVHVDDLDE